MYRQTDRQSLTRLCLTGAKIENKQQQNREKQNRDKELCGEYYLASTTTNGIGSRTPSTLWRERERGKDCFSCSHLYLSPLPFCLCLSFCQNKEQRGRFFSAHEKKKTKKIKTKTNRKGGSGFLSPSVSRAKQYKNGLDLLSLPRGFRVCFCWWPDETRRQSLI